MEQTWQKADLAAHGIPDRAPTQAESEQKVDVGTAQESYRSLLRTAGKKNEERQIQSQVELKVARDAVAGQKGSPTATAAGNNQGNVSHW